MSETLFDFGITVINKRKREFEEESTKRTGSVFGKRFIQRDRVELDQKLNEDYFNDRCRFPDKLFERRFRIVLKADAKFALLKDAQCLPEASTRQKVASGIRLPDKGSVFDAMNKYFGISESSSADYFVRFLKVIIKSFGNEYLRKSNTDDVKRLLVWEEMRGFPGILSSLDCMHWEWESFPSSWKGQYLNRKSNTTMVLKAVASYDLWI
ncbi:hypothetical protein A0J61_11420 [Choanephora cucurbitarum]|uniref:Uncharacterized protein n=1 Tax=Choanephora cucurbitarum TaxID=101091 RepID=A0A1C7MUK3_9FUNG|nr:hypothetical protein A0J61_11420 [Choanephora cucurbitarum]